MDAKTLRQTFLDHLRANGHAIIGGAPLIPEHDANVQKCLRTNDIAEVGDARHLTFFEMLGNWSLGDYWKHEAIRLSYTFLTERLHLDPERLSVTCFAGDADAPRDLEAAAIWRSFGISEERIFFLPKDENWWGPVGLTGPC